MYDIIIGMDSPGKCVFTWIRIKLKMNSGSLKIKILKSLYETYLSHHHLITSSVYLRNNKYIAEDRMILRQTLPWMCLVRFVWLTNMSHSITVADMSGELCDWPVSLHSHSQNS